MAYFDSALESANDSQKIIAWARQEAQLLNVFMITISKSDAERLSVTIDQLLLIIEQFRSGAKYRDQVIDSLQAQNDELRESIMKLNERYSNIQKQIGWKGAFPIKNQEKAP